MGRQLYSYVAQQNNYVQNLQVWISFDLQGVIQPQVKPLQQTVSAVDRCQNVHTDTSPSCQSITQCLQLKNQLGRLNQVRDRFTSFSVCFWRCFVRYVQVSRISFWTSPTKSFFVKFLFTFQLTVSLKSGGVLLLGSESSRGRSACTNPQISRDEPWLAILTQQDEHQVSVHIKICKLKINYWLTIVKF